MRIRIGNTDDTHVCDRVVSEEETLELSGCDLETSDFEDLFETIYDKEVTIL